MYRSLFCPSLGGVDERVVHLLRHGLRPAKDVRFRDVLLILLYKRRVRAVRSVRKQDDRFIHAAKRGPCERVLPAVAAGDTHVVDAVLYVRLESDARVLVERSGLGIRSGLQFPHFPPR